MSLRPLHHIVLPALFIAGAALSQPKLSIDTPVIDLGIVYGGEKKIGHIKLTNSGSDTLRIFSAEPSCGCTMVTRPREFLLPHQTDDVEYEFTPAGELGIVEKEILIRTNDPASQTRKVKLIADIREFLRPIGGSNMITIIGNAVVRKSVTRWIAMKNVSGFPVSILGDSVSTPSVTISMDNTRLLPNDTLNVRITVVPEKPGLSLETVYLLTDHKSIPRVEIKITIFGTQGN